MKKRFALVHPDAVESLFDCLSRFCGKISDGKATLITQALLGQIESEESVAKLSKDELINNLYCISFTVEDGKVRLVNPHSAITAIAAYVHVQKPYARKKKWDKSTSSGGIHIAFAGFEETPHDKIESDRDVYTALHFEVVELGHGIPLRDILNVKTRLSQAMWGRRGNFLPEMRSTERTISALYKNTRHYIQSGGTVYECSGGNRAPVKNLEKLLFFQHRNLIGQIFANPPAGVFSEHVIEIGHNSYVVTSQYFYAMPSASQPIQQLKFAIADVASIGQEGIFTKRRRIVLVNGKTVITSFFSVAPDLSFIRKILNL